MRKPLETMLVEVSPNADSFMRRGEVAPLIRYSSLCRSPLKFRFQTLVAPKRLQGLKWSGPASSNIHSCTYDIHLRLLIGHNRPSCTLSESAKMLWLEKHEHEVLGRISKQNMWRSNLIVTSCPRYVIKPLHHSLPVAVTSLPPATVRSSSECILGRVPPIPLRRKVPSPNPC